MLQSGEARNVRENDKKGLCGCPHSPFSTRIKTRRDSSTRIAVVENPYRDAETGGNLARLVRLVVLEDDDLLADEALVPEHANELPAIAVGAL